MEDSDQWNTVVTKHAAKWPYERSKKSIWNKYSSIKKYVEGLERIPSAEVQQGRAPIVLGAGDESSIYSSIVRPSRVQSSSSTPSTKRPYSKVLDATVFNEYLKSQQEKDKENCEIAFKHSKISKEASQIAKETNQM